MRAGGEGVAKGEVLIDLSTAKAHHALLSSLPDDRSVAPLCAQLWYPLLLLLLCHHVCLRGEGLTCVCGVCVWCVRARSAADGTERLVPLSHDRDTERQRQALKQPVKFSLRK